MLRPFRLQAALASVGILLATAASALAEPTLYPASIDLRPGFESSFTFDFGGGFVETAMISNTQFTLEVDPVSLPGGSAEFKSYYQEIESINLPDPLGGTNPIPTGDITVEILPGTGGQGTYDVGTGQFTTSEVYRVHVTGDLSAYGLTEGFVDLPSFSTGTITLEESVGTIQQRWEGEYTFPGSNVTIQYRCAVNSLIVPEPSALGLLLGGVCLLARRFRSK